MNAAMMKYGKEIFLSQIRYFAPKKDYIIFDNMSKKCTF